MQKPDIDLDILDDFSKYPEYDAKDEFEKSPILGVFDEEQADEEPTTKSEFQKKSFNLEDLESQPESPQVLNLFPFRRYTFQKSFA